MLSSCVRLCKYFTDPLKEVAKQHKEFSLHHTGVTGFTELFTSGASFFYKFVMSGVWISKKEKKTLKTMYHIFM